MKIVIWKEHNSNIVHSGLFFERDIPKIKTILRKKKFKLVHTKAPSYGEFIIVNKRF